MRPNIAIVGSGPAAAFTYRACVDYGCKKIEVFTDRMGTPQRGAFYFHWLPDNLAMKYEPDEILVIGVGTSDRYFRKQWPEIPYESGHSTSFPDTPYTIAGWDPVLIWIELWKDARISIMAEKYSDSDLKDLSKYHDIIFLTFPTQESMDAQGEYMVKIPIHLADPSLSQTFQISNKAILSKYKHFILYNGTEHLPWVRMNRLWGQISYEFTHGTLFETSKSMTYQQDLKPNTPRWTKMPAKNIMPVGRFARWDRKYLSHQAYADAGAALILWDEGYRDFKELV